MADVLVFLFLILIGLMVISLVAAIVFGFYMGLTYEPEKDKFVDSVE